ncbi:lipase family protein [Corynebacterium mendelii]|uniref:Triacylglycerol lipase n=1 Tax=Corynebacterium mendelii TaxID=2765362 RepID=A0A939E0Y7_9CORY|nr:lipase family protein [Corynebacterium mendelii]MBN9643527.1 triacylglycerol lipase [Corynebacterium mendelii]
MALFSRSTPLARPYSPVRLMRTWSKIGVPLVADFWTQVLKESAEEFLTDQPVRPWQIQGVAPTGDTRRSPVIDAATAAAMDAASIRGFFGLDRCPRQAVRLPGDAAAGDVLRTVPVTVLGTPKVIRRCAATRFDYVTRDDRGELIPAGAVVVRPEKTPARKRPLVAVAPSTQGVAPHCDPSRSCQVGVRVSSQPVDAVIAYELPVILALLAKGMDVVFIDYPRDPATGIQLYANHTAAGRALIDAVVAAGQLGIDPDVPVGLWGFSQGGGATAWVTDHGEETAAINVAAAFTGAPPCDLLEVGASVDGGAATGVLCYAMAALIATRPDVRAALLPELSPTGIAKLRASISTCAGGTVVTAGWRPTTSWSNDGRSLAELALDIEPVRAALSAQTLGGGTPRWPVLVATARHDDVIPAAQVRRLVRAWKATGAEVVFHDNRLPGIPLRTASNHFVPYYLMLPAFVDWLAARLAAAGR